MADSKHSDHEKQRAFLAAVYEDLTEAANMVKADPDCVHYRSSVGETAFHYVIIERELKLAEALLGWGSDIDSQTNFGASPLIHATMLKYLDAVKWLVAKGASLESKTVTGETALAYAATNENAAIYKFLIGIPRKHPIDFYFDDLSADAVFRDKELVMRSHLIELGLTRRYDTDDEES